MRIVFFGTPDYVLPVLEKLYKYYGPGEDGICAVVTQSPKETGRNKFVERSAVDNWAYKHKIPVIYNLSDTPEAALGVVAAYGKIIPKDVINKFGSGILNIHPSPLPLYRGASPIQAQIAAGETETAISIIKMDELMDHGPILTQSKETIEKEDTNETLRIRLFKRAADMLIEMLPNYLNSKITLKEQDHTKATFTKLIKRDDGFVDIASQTPTEVERIIRAYNPWPGVWTKVKIDGKIQRLKILNAHIESEELVLDEVQLEGKGIVTFKQFTEGYPNHSFQIDQK